MTRHAFTFLGTFVLGALLALVARAALYAPDAGHEAALAGGGNYAPMVSNAASSDTAHAHASPASSATTTKPAAATAKNDDLDHSVHATAAKSANEPADASAVADQPVNTVCAICGMEVDPDLPTATYQGKTIGFGCRACPPKFKADPDKYGPAYLRNEVIGN